MWLARDRDFHRGVALKEIRPDRAANPELWRRFLKEAQITGQLEHPNIVPVYELGRRREDDQPFYTMRSLRGQSLLGAIREFHRESAGKVPNRLALQSLLGAFLKVCDAIGYAHARGVVHRDLKPENVVLGGYGEVVVLDWGLAKLVDMPEERIDPDAETVDRVSVSVETGPTRPMGSWARPATWRRSRSKKSTTRSTAGPTSMPSAASCSRSSRAIPRPREQQPPTCWRGSAPVALPAPPGRSHGTPALEAVCAKAMALRAFKAICQGRRPRRRGPAVDC